MFKIYRNYLSFFQHLVDNEYYLAVKINNTFFAQEKEKRQAVRSQPYNERYYRVYPGSNNEQIHGRRLLGGLQPLANMHKDFVNTFKLYKSWQHIGADALQPIYGLGNILNGLLTFIGACFYVPLARFGIIRENEDMRTNYGSSWFLNSFSNIIRGITQLIFTPFMPLKIFFRGIATSIMGWQKVDQDYGINRLVREATKLAANSDKTALVPHNSLDIIAYELERKVDKAMRLNRSSSSSTSPVVSEENKVTAVVKTIFLYRNLEKENSKDLNNLGAKILSPVSDTDLAAQARHIGTKENLISSLESSIRQPSFYSKK